MIKTMREQVFYFIYVIVVHFVNIMLLYFDLMIRLNSLFLIEPSS